jgi:acyl dehydratase
VAAPRYFEDIPVGEVLRSPGRTVTEADVVRFASITGDPDGLDRSRVRPGEAAAVPDTLVMTLTSGLGFRVAAPQPLVLAFMVVDWHFVAPVRLGDTVSIQSRVTGKRGLKEGGVLVEKREILNQRGEVVQEGEYKLLVARRPRE